MSEHGRGVIYIPVLGNEPVQAVAAKQSEKPIDLAITQIYQDTPEVEAPLQLLAQLTSYCDKNSSQKSSASRALIAVRAQCLAPTKPV
jgi:hypothetical protein